MGPNTYFQRLWSFFHLIIRPQSWPLCLSDAWPVSDGAPFWSIAPMCLRHACVGADARANQIIATHKSAIVQSFVHVSPSTRYFFGSCIERHSVICPSAKHENPGSTLILSDALFFDRILLLPPLTLRRRSHCPRVRSSCFRPRRGRPPCARRRRSLCCAHWR